MIMHKPGVYLVGRRYDHIQPLPHRFLAAHHQHGFFILARNICQFAAQNRTHEQVIANGNHQHIGRCFHN